MPVLEAESEEAVLCITSEVQCQAKFFVEESAEKQAKARELLFYWGRGRFLQGPHPLWPLWLLIPIAMITILLTWNITPEPGTMSLCPQVYHMHVHPHSEWISLEETPEKPFSKESHYTCGKCNYFSDRKKQLCSACSNLIQVRVPFIKCTVPPEWSGLKNVKNFKYLRSKEN